MAAKSDTELKDDINTRFPDNTTQEISPHDLREVTTDIVDSKRNRQDGTWNVEAP